MLKWMKRWIEPIVPLYAVIPLIVCFLWNDIIYFVIRLFMENAHHYDFTTALDRMIPFEPAWVSIYILCYVYWIINYVLIGRAEKKKFYRIITADLIARCICGLFFIFLPTTNVRPEITGTGIWDQLMAFIYSVDAPTNLFPSIHCMTSWICYLGVRGRKDVPKWYQWFSLVFTILICASTQFTKQHYLVDIAGGIILAQGCYMLCMKYNWYQPVMRVFDRINSFLRGKVSTQ